MNAKNAKTPKNKDKTSDPQTNLYNQNIVIQLKKKKLPKEDKSTQDETYETTQ